MYLGLVDCHSCDCAVTENLPKPVQRVKLGMLSGSFNN